MIYLPNLLHIFKLHTTTKQEVDTRLQESFCIVSWKFTVVVVCIIPPIIQLLNTHCCLFGNLIDVLIASAFSLEKKNKKTEAISTKNK